MIIENGRERGDGTFRDSDFLNKKLDKKQVSHV